MKPAKKCMVWNPYTQTLKLATMPQTLENWYATIGTGEVSAINLKNGHGATCIYSEQIETTIPYVIQFRDWVLPLVGIVLFVGPPDEEGETMDLSEAAMAHVRQCVDTALKGDIFKVLTAIPNEDHDK